MAFRDTHTIKNYNSYQLHQGQGIATRVREQGPTSPEDKPLLTRDQLLDKEEIRYNSKSQSSPMSQPSSQNAHFQQHEVLHKGERGLATQLHPQVPASSLIGKDTRTVLKDALAASHAVSRPQDFPAFQPSPISGVARGAAKPNDTPLFIPQNDPSPKRRLHQLSEEYLQKIWREDQRKDDCAQKMETNVVGSPMNHLRRGDAVPDTMNNSGRRHNIVTQHVSQLDNATPDHPTGRAHNVIHNVSNFQLSTDPVQPVLSGRRHNKPATTKASIY